MKLYCHYFNNKQSYPYATERVFLHENAEYCKYGGKCERIMCMFKHEQPVTEVFEEEFADVVTVNEDTEIIVTDIHEEERVDQDETIVMKDTNKFDTVLPNRAEVCYQDNLLQCNRCDFASVRKREISDHKTTIHSWCCICFSSRVRPIPIYRYRYRYRYIGIG